MPDDIQAKPRRNRPRAAPPEAAPRSASPSARGCPSPRSSTAPPSGGGSRRGEAVDDQRRPRAEDASLVEGHLADRRRLLLDARLPAGHRSPRRGRGGADRHRHPRPRDAAGRAAGLRPGGRAQLRRPGLDRHAREPARGLEGQGAGARAARLRGHGLRDHDDAVGRRRRQARDREPVPPRRPRRSPGPRHPRDPHRSRGGLPQGLQGGDRPRRGRRPALPGPEPRGPRARGLGDPRPTRRCSRTGAPPSPRRATSPWWSRARSSSSRSSRWASAASRRACPSCPSSTAATPTGGTIRARTVRPGAGSPTPGSCC